MNHIPAYPAAINEPVLEYRPHSPERILLEQELTRQSSHSVEIPCWIGGEPVYTGKTDSCRMPHEHHHTLALFHKAGANEVHRAIEAAKKAEADWSRWPALDRAAIFLKAAELLSTKYRAKLNAATMLGQSKTCLQAELDSACELIDFFRFNVRFLQELYEMQPISGRGYWNQMEYRALEGFVFAVTPFNFTAIGGNLPTSAALMGNVVIWKPASTAVYSNYFILELLHEAGLPPGVIQFLPGSGAEIGDILVTNEDLAGIHFTGGTNTFNQLWAKVGQNISRYRSYPRIVGETGGKDFVFAHSSADLEGLVTALVRGAFEYQGQKCSAASRAYIPQSIWPKLKERLVEEVRSIRMGDVRNFQNFMGAVIDKNSFENITEYIHSAKQNKNVEVLVGGKGNSEVGYFIEPTVLLTQDPLYRTMCEEIFGPVLTVYVYDDKKLDEILSLCNATSRYALTGCIWAQDRAIVRKMTEALRNAAGNFYINNKPTGAVVGQQPFGGARASGTNDKAGSLFNLLRWVNVRTISETFSPPVQYPYPHMQESEQSKTE